MKDKVDKAFQMLKTQGHSVKEQLHGENAGMHFQVDGWMLVSWEEMQELADGLYSLAELEELYKLRQAEAAAQRGK